MKELTVLFLMKENAVLLAMKKRGFGEGKWNGVGGKVEVGETIEEAFIRETQEEITVTPILYKKVADITFDELHENERKLMHVTVFTCTEWSGEPEETEEMRPEWFKLDNIPYSQMWADDQFWLPQVLDGKKLRAKFVLNDADEVAERAVEEVAEIS